MKTKNLMVSFVLMLALIGSVAAVSFTGDLAVSPVKVKVNDMNVNGSVVSVVAGEDVTVSVYFTADKNDTDVTVEAQIEGEKVKTYASTGVFDVEKGMKYVKTLVLKVPFELKDEISTDLDLSVTIDGKEYDSETTNDVTLRVQRPSYNAVVKSVTTPSSISAGENFPIEIVLKNMGYNNLDDVYVTARIKALDVYQGPKWFGDVLSLEDDSYYYHDNNYKDDTAYGKLNLKVPYNAPAGVYALEVIVSNDDTETSVVKQIVISNDFAENVISTSATKTVAEGEEANYDLLIVNPTNNVKVYKIVMDSEGITSTASQTVIAVPAGSSKTVKIKATSNVEGEHSFNVNVFSGENLESTEAFTLNVEGKKTNTVFVLTVILSIVFLVLLVALIVLLGRKPESTEEFGESYY